MLSSALKTLQHAFEHLSVRVELASSHTSLFSTTPDQERLVGVLGGWPSQEQTGELINLTRSAVYYWPILENAQIAIGYARGQGVDCGQSWCTQTPSYPPQTPSDLATFQRLMAAIGTGIGNSAAHELGHQYQSGTPTLPYMDCGHDVDRVGGSISCEVDGNGHVNNFVYNFFGGSGFSQDPLDANSTGAQFKYVVVPGAPAIQWGPAEFSALTQQLNK